MIVGLSFGSLHALLNFINGELTSLLVLKSPTFPNSHVFHHLIHKHEHENEEEGPYEQFRAPCPLLPQVVPETIKNILARESAVKSLPKD